MRLTEERLKELLRGQTLRSTPREAECLGDDQFLRAATGELSSEERRAIARHLITCMDCTEEYQLLRSLKPWSEEAQATVSTAGDTAALHARPRLRIVEQSAWRSSSERHAMSMWQSRSALAIAAVLLISLMVGSWLLFRRNEATPGIARLNEEVTERDRRLASTQESLDQARLEIAEARRRAEEATANAEARHRREIADLRRSVKEIARPQLDVPIIDLDPSEATRGDQGEAASITIPPAANLITLILNFTNKKHARYAVEVFDHAGKRIWSGAQSQKGATRSVNVTLSRSFIPPGLYTIRLFGMDGTRELIANYTVRIEK